MKKSMQFKFKNLYTVMRLASVAIITVAIMFILIKPSPPVKTPVPPILIHEDDIKKENFIATVAPFARMNYEKYNILPSITIAQSILESDWGESILSKEHSNYFGIKSNKETDNRVVYSTNEYVDGILVDKNDAFRVYDDLEASINHHGLLIGTADRYIPVLNSINYIEAANELYSCGYSTDPYYAQKIITIIEKYKLYNYDGYIN